MLTSVPNDHLYEILRRLPIKDVVRTSNLAKAWCNQWAMCHGLQLAFFSSDLLGVVDSVLSKYTCCVEVFEVHFTNQCCSMLEGWFHDLANRGVSSIKFYYVPATLSEVAMVPNSLFMCLGVTKLFLGFCKIPPLPSTFQGFRRLELLDVNEVTFPKNGERTFEALIAMSPLLKTLRIMFPMFEGHEDGHIYSEWTIRVPKVEYLDIRSQYDYGWQIIDLPSIIEAHITIKGPSIKRILSGLAKVRKLHMDVRFPPYN
jgi:hypothetical protein